MKNNKSIYLVLIMLLTSFVNGICQSHIPYPIIKIMEQGRKQKVQSNIDYYIGVHFGYLDTVYSIGNNELFDQFERYMKSKWNDSIVFVEVVDTAIGVNLSYDSINQKIRLFSFAEEGFNGPNVLFKDDRITTFSRWEENKLRVIYMLDKKGHMQFKREYLTIGDDIFYLKYVIFSRNNLIWVSIYNQGVLKYEISYHSKDCFSIMVINDDKKSNEFYTYKKGKLVR